MKHYKFLILVCLLISILFGGCGGKQEDETQTTPSQADVTLTSATAASTEPATEAATTVPAETAEAETTQPATIVVGGEVHTIPEKDGDMIFTDDANNKFIRAVAEKYGVDTNLLACIYANPSDDNNFVWQFSGETDANGKLSRTADTLIYIYLLSADCKTISRTGGLTGNDGISAPSGYLLMQTTKRLMIPEFQDQLNA